MPDPRGDRRRDRRRDGGDDEEGRLITPPTEPADLPALRAAGRIAARARALGAGRILTGVSPTEVCTAVEAEIARLGGALAFPAQIAINEVAAHFRPEPGDRQVFHEGDLAKLDLGVHIDGWVVDTAVTVNVGDRPDRRRFLAAVREALGAALRCATPGGAISDISRETARAIQAHDLRPIRNLCGHGVGRWIVHGPPPIPSQPESGATTRLTPGATVALEVFATDGDGMVMQDGRARIFRVDPGAVLAGVDPPLASALRALRGLPFAPEQIAGLPLETVVQTLARLVELGQARAYRPLVERPGALIAQAEHTIHVHPDHVEVLTADSAGQD